MDYFFSFDVESNGLLGDPFAVGWVVMMADREKGEYKELENGYLSMNVPVSEDPDTHAWMVENVFPALPPPTTEQFCGTPGALYTKFWCAWQRYKEVWPSIIMVTDCPFPVEAGFLLRVSEYLGWGMADSPYPILDAASVLFAHGLDPLANYKRLRTELPAHNPVNDARQSIRVMLEVMNGVIRASDTANLDIPGLR